MNSHLSLLNCNVFLVWKMQVQYLQHLLFSCLQFPFVTDTSLNMHLFCHLHNKLFIDSNSVIIKTVTHPKCFVTTPDMITHPHHNTTKHFIWHTFFFLLFPNLCFFFCMSIIVPLPSLLIPQRCVLLHIQ